jgi:hypothetical protein
LPSVPEVRCDDPHDPATSRSSPQYAFYWPDGAIRSAAAWLLVDVECDRRGRREQQRQERDRRDLRFRRRGWYVARIGPEATGHWPVATAHDLTRLVQ